MTHFNDFRVQPGNYLAMVILSLPPIQVPAASSQRGVEYDYFLGRCTPLDLFEFTL